MLEINNRKEWFYYLKPLVDHCSCIAEVMGSNPVQA